MLAAENIEIGVRDGTFDDFPAALELAREVYKHTPFADMPMNESQVQRIWQVMRMIPEGYVRVVEKNGVMTGAMVGRIAENHFGLRCACDHFMFAKGGTRSLLEDFISWADSQNADFVHITDLCGLPGYGEMLQKVGLKPCGTNYMRKL